MQRTVGILLVALAFATVVQSGPAALAASHRYGEDFTTSLHRDVERTTAWWDTVSAAIRLFPFETVISGSCDTPGVARGITVAGDRAFVADGTHGLQVIDISDLGHPLLAGSLDTPGMAVDVIVAGDYAYLADSASGLQVIDISDPAHPALVGTCDTPGIALDVVVAGALVFVADGNAGLQVVDVSNPTHPSLIGDTNTPGFATGVAIAGDHAFVSEVSTGLQVVDISDPYLPAVVGTCATASNVQDVEVSGDLAFLAAYATFQVIDVADPAQPVLLASLATPGDAYDISLSGDRALVADLAAGLQVFDISDPAHPALRATCDTPGLAMGVTTSGIHALVADQAAGIQVIAVGLALDPVTVGDCSLAFQSNDVVVAGHRAFVANENGLMVVDASDPLNPVLAGSCATNGIATGVAVAGDHAYVTNPWLSLQVIDISDPTRPVRVGSCATPGTASGVAVAGDRAYVADGAAGLQVLDISDPAQPILLGTCDTPGGAVAITLSGSYAYVADGASGVQVIDVADAGQPVIVGNWIAPGGGTPGFAAAIAIAGDRAYVANGDRGLQVLDITEPASPIDVGGNALLAHANDIAVSGDLAYVATAGGLGVVDITRPWYPDFNGTFGAHPDAFSVAVSGAHAFLTGRTSGLEVLQVAQDDFDTGRNIASSLSVAATGAPVFKARLTTTQTSAVTWALSADGGANWTEMTPGGWHTFEAPGPDLRWRSRHAWATPGVNPAASRLEIDWLLEAAPIDSVVDLPHDQGGWVRVHFTRSCRDFADEVALPIASYGIWRRVDDADFAAGLASAGSATAGGSGAEAGRHPAGVPVVTRDGRTFTGSAIAKAAFPPGLWEWVATVPAVQQDAYIAVAPTVADATATDPHEAVFVLTAHTTTPSVWYAGDPAAGHSVDNLPPEPPARLAGAAHYTPEGLQLTWQRNVENDLAGYAVYRGTSADFVPSEGNRIAAPSANAHFDADWRPGSGDCYKVSAVDIHANESAYASLVAGQATDVDTPGSTTMRLRLLPNRPNPFNPRTTLRFEVPQPGTARLCVFDLAGRLVRTLVAGDLPAGSHEAEWDGRDASGREVGSGSYVARLECGGGVALVGMQLVR